MEIEQLIELFKDYAILLIPYLLIEMGLAIAALVHVVRNPVYRVGNRVIWILVVLCFQIIGPIVYFVFGRGENE